MAMSELNTDKVIIATRTVLRNQPKDSLNNITPRQIRTLVEQELGLESGALDDSLHKKVVKAAANEFIDELAVEAADEPLKNELSPKTQTNKAQRKKNGDSDESQSQKKRKRTSKVVDSVVDSDVQDEPTPPSKKAKALKSSGSGQAPTTKKTKATPTEKAFGQFLDLIGTEMKRDMQNSVETDDDELAHASKPALITEFDSDLSSVVDESPGKRRRKKGESTKEPKKTKETKATKTARDKKVTTSLDKNEEEIKRLKSFIVACGLRKAWSKEFKGLDKPSQQIAHLKKLLADLGMTGRLSMEKAKNIRAQRELQREIQDVVEFDRKRGSGAQSQATETQPASESDNEEEDEVVKPARNKLQSSIAAFLADQSDEE